MKPPKEFVEHEPWGLFTQDWEGQGLCLGTDDVELSTLLSNVCWPASKASCTWTALYTNSTDGYLQSGGFLQRLLLRAPHLAGRPPTDKHTVPPREALESPRYHLLQAGLSDGKEPASNPF